MHCQNLDAYFHMAAQGNKDAYGVLYEEFRNRAFKIIRIAISQMSNLTGNPADFSEIVDEMFFKIINEYDWERGSFSNYVEYALNHRLIFKVQNELIEYANQYAIFAEEFEDNTVIECLADPNQRTIQSEVAVNNFKAYISSKDRSKTLKDRKRDKILLMQYLGYTYSEICKELKLTIGELRGYIKKIQEDEDIINFKLELK